MKEQLEMLNSVTINFGTGGMMIVNIILAFVMFGVALGLKPRMLKEIIDKPKSILVGLLLQWFALPAVTFAIAFILNPFRHRLRLLTECHRRYRYRRTRDRT